MTCLFYREPPTALPGADFHDASIEPLFVGAPLRLPLPLLGQEQLGNLVTDVDRAPSRQNFNTLTIADSPSVSSSTSGDIVIFIPPPGGRDTTVFEAGLGARGAEPPGSHTGSPSFPATTSGTIMFTAMSGVQSVSLGGHVLTGQPQTFTDATGSLTASVSFSAGGGTISYSYRLNDNTLGDPSSKIFTVAVTGADGSASDNLVIGIVDDFRPRVRIRTALRRTRSRRKPAMCSTVRARRRERRARTSSADGATVVGARRCRSRRSQSAR